MKTGYSSVWLESSLWKPNAVAESVGGSNTPQGGTEVHYPDQKIKKIKQHD